MKDEDMSKGGLLKDLEELRERLDKASGEQGDVDNAREKHNHSLQLVLQKERETTDTGRWEQRVEGELA